MFDRVMTAVPVVPGVIVGVETVTEASEDGGPTSRLDGAVLFTGVGSVAADVAVTDPPVRVSPGVAFAGSESGTVTVAVAALAIGPAMVQVIGPVKGPVQPAGRLVIVVPAGGA
jgi:hypothetical protein